jgi:tRNA pseudouridine55 synthase
MIFAVYKPIGSTSHDVLQRLRRAAGTKKIGHAGTLDPLAEGVLVVAIGRESTKKLSAETAKEKEYRAEITLGATTTTDDKEGIHINGKKKKLNLQEIKEVVRLFIGIHPQAPPRYSAIKIRGVEAYKRARKGEQFTIKARNAYIKEIAIEAYAWPILTIRAVTGPGVYIRSLARDIGEKLGTGAYLSGLIRTRVGMWTIDKALPLEDAVQKALS